MKYVASRIRVAVADMILQRVDEGRIDLDVRVAEMLPRPLSEYEECGAPIRAWGLRARVDTCGVDL